MRLATHFSGEVQFLTGTKGHTYICKYEGKHMDAGTHNTCLDIHTYMYIYICLCVYFQHFVICLAENEIKLKQI